MDLPPEQRAALEHLLSEAERESSADPFEILVAAALEAKARRVRNTSDGGHIFAAMRAMGKKWPEIAERVDMAESTIRYWYRGVVS